MKIDDITLELSKNNFKKYGKHRHKQELLEKKEPVSSSIKDIVVKVLTVCNPELDDETILLNGQPLPFSVSKS